MFERRKIINPWEGKMEPFRIIGNVYFVGTFQASVHMIDTGDGLIMIDTGYRNTLYLVLQSIYKLGFVPEDIKYIINTHWHGDHTEATKAFAQLSGAKTLIGREDEEKAKKYFQPDILVRDGDKLELGNTVITFAETPGHTKGTISLFFDTEDNATVYRVGMFGGAGANTLARGVFDYPGCREGYRASIARLRNEKVDVFIGNHVWNNNTAVFGELLQTTGENHFIDSSLWGRFLDYCEERLDLLEQKELEEADKMDAKLSVWTSYYVDMSPEDAVLELKRNGLSCAELSDEHGKMLLDRGDDAEAIGRQFKQFLEKEEFAMPQGHLWLRCKICSEPDAVEILKDWLVMYDAIGVKNAVLHTDAIAGEEGLSLEERCARNIEQLRKLEAFIKEKSLSIKICLENLGGLTRNIDILLYLLEQLDTECFGICLDTGHLNITDKGKQREFILKAGKHLCALHIADNEGQTDQHMMPFGRGNVEFAEIMQALKEIGYTGLFNLEIPGERLAPMEVRGYKIEYIRKCYKYLMGL